MVLGVLIVLTSVCLINNYIYRRELRVYEHDVPTLVEDSINFSCTIHVLNSLLYTIVSLLGFVPQYEQVIRHKILREHIT